MRTNCSIMTMASLVGAWVIGAPSLSAVSYTVDWCLPGCGGSIINNGNTILVSSIGQSDSAILSGEFYQLVGGFWYNWITPLSGSVPELALSQVNGEIRISWAPALPGYRLEQTVDASLSEWTDAPHGNPLTVPLTEQGLFYRLCKP